VGEEEEEVDLITFLVTGLRRRRFELTDRLAQLIRAIATEAEATSALVWEEVLVSLGVVVDEVLLKRRITLPAMLDLEAAR